MFIVYYYGKDNKYYSYDGDKFKNTKKRPKGFELKKGFEANQSGLKLYYEKTKDEAKELVDLNITKRDITTYENERQAKLYLLNAYLPEKYRMKKGKKWFSDFDRIEYEEYDFIENCNNVGLLYTKTGKFENVSAYDVNSFYSRILGDRRSQFQIPIDKPKYKTINQIPEKLEYGIYRVLITYKGKPTDDIHKLFNFSKKHYYTHIDLKYALFLQSRYKKFNVKLICDGEPNMIYYSKFIKAKSIFGAWYNHFYNAKSKVKKNSLVKFILNVWGYLCRQSQPIIQPEKVIDSWSEEKQNKFDFEYDKVKNGEQYFKCLKLSNIYRYSLARMKPFLLSTVRSRMRDYISSSNSIDKIIRIYIDSFILSEDNKFFEKKKESIKHDKYHKKDIEIEALNKIKILN